ncbi:MAG: PH domain-containing protein [Ruminococcus sp.]|nr:PH domain-containing protein [Ruminococcus sp.]
MSTRTDLEAMVGSGEQVLWRGTPLKKCFIFESIFNPMLPFALLWAVFDIGFIVLSSKSSNQSGADKSLGIFLIVFFAIHLMPVWLYLGGVLLSFRRYKNTAYIITDKGIYVSGGTFTYNCRMKPFTELSNVNIHRGIFDQMFNVGDVVLSSQNSVVYAGRAVGSGNSLTITDIAEYQEVFSLVKQLQTDVYSDTMYPNDLRPEENHGYQTKYKGRM